MLEDKPSALSVQAKLPAGLRIPSLCRPAVFSAALDAAGKASIFRADHAAYGAALEVVRDFGTIQVK